MMHMMKCEVQDDKWVWRCDCGRIVWIMKEDNEIIIIREGDYKADHTGFTVKLPEEE